MKGVEESFGHKTTGNLLLIKHQKSFSIHSRKK